MKSHKYDILFFSSDSLAETGLHHLLRSLPVTLNALAVEKLPNLLACCEKYRPKVIIYLFHDNMPLSGVLQSLYSHHQNYPETRQLVITERLLPVFGALKRWLTSVNVVSLRASLAELSWVITADLMGVRSQTPATHYADIMLPERQLRVLLMLSWSYSAEQIAQRLGISAKTVYAHKLNALTRLQIHTKHDLADLYAIIDELRMIVTLLRHQRKDKENGGAGEKYHPPNLSWKL